MPELPDVEILRRYVDATSLHRRIAHVHVRDRSLLEDATPQRLAAALVGNRLESTRRRGKLLGACAGEGGWLILHFGMSGDLEAYGEGSGEPEHTALLLDFEDGRHLACTSVRRLGRISWSADFDRFVEKEGLGPDALETGLEEFRDLVAGHRGAVKSLLLNQGVVAGIGNLYADEILFQAGIAPGRAVGELSGEDVGRLHRALRHVLRIAIERQADPDEVPDTWLLPRRGEDAACPRCGAGLRHESVGGRTTFWCPRCQR